MAAMRFFEIGDGEMEVTLGGGEGAMAEDFLNVAQVGFVFEQMRGATVSPQVAGDVLFASSEPGVFGKSLKATRGFT
jgi:hypothetical protein